MKKSELKKCVRCGQGVMHAGCLMFYRVRVERMLINMPAVQRQHGLELMLGGNAALASVMGPDEDLAKSFGDAQNVVVCQDCSIKVNVAEIDEGS